MNFNKEYIFTNYDQEEVMAEYLAVSTSDIQYSLNTNKPIINHVRCESHPSLVFRYYGNKLVAKDFGNISYRGDIFEIAGNVIGIDCNNSYGFNLICDDIVQRMENISSRYKRLKAERLEAEKEKKIDTHQCEITPLYRSFTKNDYAYFAQYSLGRKIVDNNYRAVRCYYLNDFKSPYRHDKLDPCYSFIPNPNKIKLYFPFRGKSQARFITNSKFPIEQIYKLKYSDYLILIKAYKDKLLLDKTLNALNVDNIQVLSISSETARLRQDVVDFLRKHIRKDIFICLDADDAGYASMSYYRDVYGFKVMTPHAPYKHKDPSDLCKQVRFEKFTQIIKLELKQQRICHSIY